MITAIIFDLDGTLMNTLDDLHDSVLFALAQAGMQSISKADTRRYLGSGVKRLIHKSVEHVCPDATEKIKDDVLAAFQTHYMKHSMDKTAPYDGIMPMLHEVKKRGVATAIVSNKLDPAVKDLHQAFFADCIDVAIGESAAMKRKPAPDMVNEALRQLSVLHGREINRAEAVYVGDSEVDIQTALASSLPCISVGWGFRDRSWLESMGANPIIDRPEEILDYLAD